MKPAPSDPVINDKLYTLDTALCAEKMLPVFSDLGARYFGPGHVIESLKIEVMRRRNQRCVIRYISSGRDLRRRQDFTWRVVGKVFKANRGERVYELMKQLWVSGFSRERADGVSIPEPIAFSSSLCLLFQEEVPGDPIKVLIKANPQEKYMRQLARTLAKLHASPIQVKEVFGIHEHLLRCHPRYPFLALAVPEFEPMIDYIVEEALLLEAKFRHVRPVPLHGDFHLGQVHIWNGKAWLVDLDGLSMGDPASDLGNLLVFLRSKTKRKPELSQMIEAFLDEYFKLMAPIDSEIAHRIPLYEGLTHLRRACKCLRYQEEGWKRKARKILEKGVQAIDKMKQTEEQANARATGNGATEPASTYPHYPKNGRYVS